MKAFAYLTHPLNIEQLRSSWPLARFLPNFAIRPLLKILPPFKLTKIKKIKSVNGKAINGYVITLPVLSEDIHLFGDQYVLDKISEATKIASRLNVGIMGLGGEFSRKSYPVKNSFKLPVTNGSHYTAWSIIESIYRISKTRKINLKQSNIAIIGASSSTGRLCAKKLSYFAPNLIISDINEKNLDLLKKEINTLNGAAVEINLSVNSSVENADLTIVISKNLAARINPDLFKKNSIIFDATLDNSFIKTINNRNDLTVIKCGLAKMTVKNKVIPTSLAETILLAMEEKFVSYSLNGNINLDKLEEIADIAVRQGLEIWVPEAPVI